MKLGQITKQSFPLFIAIIKVKPNCNKIAKLLIEAGADVNALDQDKFTPLGYAIAIGKLYSGHSTAFVSPYALNESM